MKWYFSFSKASPSDGLVSYLGHSLRGVFYSSAEMLSAYSTAPANWAARYRVSFPGFGRPFQGLQLQLISFLWQSPGIIIIITPLRVFHRTIANDFSLEFERQQFSSDFQGSSKHSS